MTRRHRWKFRIHLMDFTKAKPPGHAAQCERAKCSMTRLEWNQAGQPPCRGGRSR
jgi:hypothetical protein